MGNRAVITVDTKRSSDLGVYLHWIGGRDSVEAFLAYCKLKEYRTPESDSYGWARLCQVIGNYFGGENSIGIDVCHHLDCENGDNGVYVIKDWEIVGRRFQPHFEQREYDMHEMLTELNNSQPEKERLEQSVIDNYCNKTPELPESTLKEGEIFKDIKSLNILRMKYRELSKIHHPDHGGNSENMALINKEYKAMCSKLNAKER